MQVTMRELVEADIEIVLGIEADVFSDPWPESAFSEQLSDPKWGTLLAESEGEIVGYACWLIVQNEGHLTNMAVAKPHRRKSIAKQLLEAIFELVIDAGCEYILLEVRLGNAGAIAFYEKYGFSELYRRPKYYQSPLEDALVMVKHLCHNQAEDE